MSQLNSVRLPATIIFTALLGIIMASASRTTYKLAAASEPAKGGYALAACEARPATIVPRPEPPRTCPWPQSWPQSLSQPLSEPWPHHTRPYWLGIPVPGISAAAAPEHALLGDLRD
jgi:hypothetical protein